MICAGFSPQLCSLPSSSHFAWPQEVGQGRGQGGRGGIIIQYARERFVFVFTVIVSRHAVTINLLTPYKTTIQFVLAELYFNCVCLQQITWYKILLAVPKLATLNRKQILLYRLPLCPTICILQKKKRTVLPPQSGQTQCAKPTNPPQQSVLSRWAQRDSSFAQQSH